MKANITIQGKSVTQWPELFIDEQGWSITFNVIDDDNGMLDLTRFDVSFKARKSAQSINQIDGACVVTDSSNGICTYTLQDGDLNTTGLYRTQLQVSSDTQLYITSLGSFIVSEGY